MNVPGLTPKQNKALAEEFAIEAARTLQQQRRHAPAGRPSACRWPRSISTRRASTRARSSPSPTSCSDQLAWSAPVSPDDATTFLDVDKIIADPRDQDRRLLRLGRRRQDHHLGRPRRPGRRSRAQGRGAHHRPGPSAGPVARPRRAGQHPAPGRRDRHPRRRQPRRHDAGHEADLRRGGGRALHAREGRGDPGEPVLRGAVLLVLRHAGVHGDGEARSAARRGRGTTAAGT